MMKVLLCLSIAAACGNNPPRELFTPKPECKGDSVVPYMGSHQQVISNLSIGTAMDGFDLDGDGKPDNKLAAVSSLAMSAISDSFKNESIVIPIEFFDMPTVAADTCVKFAIYLGAYATDTDGDGKKAYVPQGDCNDLDPAIKPGAAEIANPTLAADLKDHNCNGKANENTDGSACTSALCMIDHDGDGFSVAQGDCDDTNAAVHPGAVEVCGDGLDNDCDGVADRSTDTAGNITACSPYSATADIPLDKLSFDAGGAPVIVFNSGTIDSSLKLLAGPSIFSVNIPVTNGITLDLKISGATIEGTLLPDGTTMTGRLGGVIDAKTADTIRGLSVSQIGLTPDNSLLDATFANLLGPLLALPKANASVQAKYPGCRTPDIDVDGDGLEAFCDSNPNDDNKSVDVCIDGDGTEIHDEVDAAGVVTKQCTEALLPNGKFRFVDGISVELNFQTTLIKSIKPPRVP